MKLPSIKYLFLKSTNTIVRFPFTIGIAIIGTLASLYVVDFSYSEYHDYTIWYHLIMTCAIGIPMFISLTFFSERLEVTNSFKLLIRSAGFIFLFLYFISLPDIFLEKHYIRMIIWILLFHLLVSFSPYIGFRNQNAFWQFNKSLFLRLLLTVLYSVVIYIGISLAMLAIDQLFKVDIKEEYYFRLWIIIVGTFSVWFFLAGVPKHYRKLDHIKTYPIGIKIFTQYILIPLVILYAIILYTYFIKVIITHDWPVGWVVYLVLGYSILGIFSYLLLYPIHEEAQNKGIRFFSKIFFYSLFPLLIMLFIAIFKRINEYGLTENRFFVILLGVWLVFNALFIIITKFKLIRIIPISLAVLALLSINGPWNVFKISKSVQLNKLEILLSKNELLKDGKATKGNKEITIEDNVAICSIMNYLTDVHGYKTLQPYFDFKLDTLFEKDTIRYYSTYEGLTKLTEVLGIEYILYNYRIDEEFYTFNFSSNVSYPEELMKISGYDYYINYRAYDYNYNYEKQSSEINDTIITNRYTLPDSSIIQISFDPNKGTINILLNDSAFMSKNIFDFLNTIENKKISSNNGYHQFNQSDLIIKSDSVKPSYEIIFNNISGTREKNTFNKINEIQANVLIGL